MGTAGGRKRGTRVPHRRRRKDASRGRSRARRKRKRFQGKSTVGRLQELDLGKHPKHADDRRSNHSGHIDRGGQRGAMPDEVSTHDTVGTGDGTGVGQDSRTRKESTTILVQLAVGF